MSLTLRTRTVEHLRKFPCVPRVSILRLPLGLLARPLLASGMRCRLRALAGAVAEGCWNAAGPRSKQVLGVAHEHAVQIVRIPAACSIACVFAEWRSADAQAEMRSMVSNC